MGIRGKVQDAIYKALEGEKKGKGFLEFRQSRGLFTRLAHKATRKDPGEKR